MHYIFDFYDIFSLRKRNDLSSKQISSSNTEEAISFTNMFIKLSLYALLSQTIDILTVEFLLYFIKRNILINFRSKSLTQKTYQLKALKLITQLRTGILTQKNKFKAIDNARFLLY